MTIKNQPQLRLVIGGTGSQEDCGYKSGLSSCLETPDTRSTVSTRSAGTFPERRHFCTAWYRTPHKFAKEPSPPAPEIARSTAFMEESMQPIVAFGQQPILADPHRTMQLMVVRTKDEARQEFARNLNAQLNAQEAPKRGRPEWLRGKIGRIVSRESCRKWLAGEDMPDQTNMSILIESLGLNEQQLRIGRWSPPPPGSQDERLAKLTKSWPSLPDKVQNAIMAVLETASAGQESEQTHRHRSTRQRGQ